ncbi:MAG: 50S ribosomal protein L4 [Candidatus Levybacteria bacterium RIFCSPHIGHO2_01_FULL_38_26]|nr:MAG: 50S ribosomal protein L4 [Candidatus Levybacteria bacterium RIFCSPHIGHO2_01_FULL_38_26]
MSLDLFDIKGKTAGKIDLPKEIFGAKINNQLLAQAVRVYLANQRKGTAETKTRGEVHGSTRKIWRQKGTGRARHGSKKAPIFVHGGIAFGPHPRDFSLKISKKMKRQALFSALSSKLKSNEIKAVTGLEKLDPKTKSMADVINNLGIDKKKRNILMITPLKNDLENVYRAARNLEGVRILNANVLNTYDVLNNRLILLMDKAVDSIKENFANAKIN